MVSQRGPVKKKKLLELTAEGGASIEFPKERVGGGLGERNTRLMTLHSNVLAKVDSLKVGLQQLQAAQPQ
jgi:hypothetical protein